MDMRQCIDNCTRCHDVCMEIIAYCLQQGGPHTSPDHIRTMLDCAEICQTSADFMLRGSPAHERLCGLCADVCTLCAKSCDSIGDDRMRGCAEECRRCAESCREMSGTTGFRRAA